MPRPVANPPNPWLSQHVEYLEDVPPAALEVYEEDARSLLSRNDSPDLPFRWSVNPYRGCYHGCAYCYARPSHEYLEWGAGTDFERKIVVKRNAPALLRAAFHAPSWRGEVLAFSGVTDCYQPLEAAYALTRGCLEVCVEYRNPVGIVTKGALVARDTDLLVELGRVAGCSVTLSIPFADDEGGRQLEPYASTISKRFAALARLSAAGVRTGVGVAPVIPGLNDSQIPAILTRARDCGASHAFMTMLRLPGSVLPVFTERLQAAVPLRAGAVLSAIRDVRGGAMNRSGFGDRMTGAGPRWQAIEQLFTTHARRLGFTEEPPRTPARQAFRIPLRQRSLFGDD
jgi:DNA repair photolyase